MSKIQQNTIILKVNPKNGSITLPKSLRTKYNIGDSIILSTSSQGIKIEPQPMTLDKLFSRPIDESKFKSDEEIEKGLEEVRANIKF
jgi:bifunctional DNA-binding transcriptional regulator/antitoxin component of YhaV-PrlF toxin-antitoxin module